MRTRPLVDPFIAGLAVCVVFAVAIVGVILSGMPSGPQLPVPWAHTSDLRAQLTNADGLQPHAAVQVAGVKVGEVYSVTYQDGYALVDMHIDPQYFDVHRDATVYLRPHGLFGPKFIDLSPGTPSQPAYADGDTIQVQHSVQPVDLDQVLSALQAPERTNLKTVIDELALAAAGRGDDVNHFLDATHTLASTLQAPVSTLDAVSPNLSDFLLQNESFNADFAQAPLDQLVANNNVVLGTLAANAGHLQSILTHADDTLANLDTALNGQSGNIRQILQELPPTIDQLNQVNDLLALFGRNLQGQDSSIPGDTNVTNGIIAAIENPKSAFSSYDVCKPGEPDCQKQPDGSYRRYYLKVRAFNVGGSNDLLNQLSAVCGLPIFQLGLPVHCPAGTTTSTSTSGSAATLTTGSDLAGFAGMLGA